MRLPDTPIIDMMHLIKLILNSALIISHKASFLFVILLKFNIISLGQWCSIHSHHNLCGGIFFQNPDKTCHKSIYKFLPTDFMKNVFKGKPNISCKARKQNHCHNRYN